MHPRMQLMNRPETRSEFEHRFHNLRELMRQGKLVQMQGVGENILNVRNLPNGRLDFLSVDELARVQANTLLQIANFRDPDDTENLTQESNRE